MRCRFPARGFRNPKSSGLNCAAKLPPLEDSGSPQSASQNSAFQNSGSQLQSGDNLQIFNLSSNAGFDQIHSAYLAAIKQYHPDNFSSYSPEFQKLAEEKSKQIILAYEKLTKMSYKST
ncbi:MAG: J domain-containing protein [Syntrophobacteraceae bacterium]